MAAWLLIGLLAPGGAARAAGPLEVIATAAVGDRTTVAVEVRNRGQTTVAQVAPVVQYQGQERRGDPAVDLAAGERQEWLVELPPPAEPGHLPAVVHVRYRDEDGHQAIPAVATVATPGLLPVPEVRATLTVSPLERFARGMVVLDNPTPAAIHGRVVVVLPSGLTIEPVSQGADVAGNGRRELPLVIQDDGARHGTTLPVWVLFEYAHGGRRHLALASAALAVVGAGPPVPPLLVGAGALAAMLAALALAGRRAARKRAGAPGA